MAPDKTALLTLLTLFGLLFAGILPATPNIQAWETANGARVLFVEAPELPMVDVRVVFDAGSARDGDKPGVTSFTSNLLSEGAGSWSAHQIAERLESVGAELDVGSLRDMAWVALRSLTEPKALDTALQTMAAVIAKPRFEKQDMERQRKAMLASLLQDEQSPASIGSKRMYELLYGGHPYAADPSGTKESVEAIKREDIQAIHQRYYVARNAVVAIVGALERKQAEAIAERVVGELPAGEHAAPIPQVPDLETAISELIDFPSTQAHLYVAQPGTYRGDPDYYTLYLGNHVLGGSGLVSILSNEVREKRGLSYSVYSYFLPMRMPGPFQLGLQTKNEQAAEALRVLTDSLRRFVKEGPTEEELMAAKQNLTGGFPLRIASNKNIVEYLAVIGFYDLPLDYLQTFTARIEAISAGQIRDAFQRRIHPERMVTVQVGRLE